MTISLLDSSSFWPIDESDIWKKAWNQLMVHLCGLKTGRIQAATRILGSILDLMNFRTKSPNLVLSCIAFAGYHWTRVDAQKKNNNVHKVTLN